FGEWGELMGDPVLATAVLDRLLHHSHVVNIRGNSYRLKEKLNTGIYSTPGTQVGQNYPGASGSN
ncbi:ATP-binding protein, partial [Paenibacillus flagellatus]